jgi:hypothetical protein
MKAFICHQKLYAFLVKFLYKMICDFFKETKLKKRMPNTLSMDVVPNHWDISFGMCVISKMSKYG